MNVRKFIAKDQKTMMINEEKLRGARSPKSVSQTFIHLFLTKEKKCDVMLSALKLWTWWNSQSIITNLPPKFSNLQLSYQLAKNTHSVTAWQVIFVHVHHNCI